MGEVAIIIMALCAATSPIAAIISCGQMNVQIYADVAEVIDTTEPLV
jgi:hypothetical protein